MNDWEVLFKGMAAGLAISAPVGPVNVLCISRTLSTGRTAGFFAGLGAAAADTIYGAIAGFSVQFVISFLIREEFWIRLVGGLLLITIGAVYYFRSPRRLNNIDKNQSTQSDSVSAFLLNLTNPTTVLSFMAVLTALGFHQPESWWQGFILIGGIFLGAMLWWSGLTLTAEHFRYWFTDRAMVWMNRIAGLAIGAFGLATVALSRVS